MHDDPAMGGDPQDRGGRRRFSRFDPRYLIRSAWQGVRSYRDAQRRKAERERELHRLDPEQLRNACARLLSPAEARPRQSAIRMRIDNHQDRSSGRTWENTSALLDDRRIIGEQGLLIANLKDRLSTIRTLLQNSDETLSQAARDGLERIAAALGVERSQAAAPDAVLQSAQAELGELLVAWEKLEHCMDEADPPSVWTFDALHYVSRRSGIEAASILTPVLIVVGALYAFAYYEVVGAPVFSLWTWQDLLNEAIQPLLVLPLALLALNGLFLIANRGSDFERPSFLFRLVLRAGPTTIAIGFACVCALLVVGLGVVQGLRDFRAYVGRSPSTDPESVLMSSGAMIDDVRLLGTTDRAAVLLIQDDNKVGANDDHPIRTLVLDREHVVCHGRRSVCALAQGRPEARRGTDTIAFGITVAPERASTALDVAVRELTDCRIDPDAIVRVYFPTQSASLDEACREPIPAGKACAPSLRANIQGFLLPVSREVRVLGFASRAWTAGENLDLAQRRGEAVAQGLEVEHIRAIAVAVGEAPFANAIATRAAGEERGIPDDPRDRRVDIVPCLGDSVRGLAGP